MNANTKEIPMGKVLTNNFGPATLIKLYKHPDTKEIVWDILADTGERMHMAQRYVDKLPRIEYVQVAA